MRSTGTISLFSVQTQPSQQPYSIVVSMAAHCVALGLVSVGIMGRPQIKETALAERYTLRHVELHQPETPVRRAAEHSAEYPVQKAAAGASRADTKPAEARPSSLRQTARLKLARQTLIQPKIPKEVTVAIDIPVPAIVIWTPEKVQVATIVPPPPQKPTAAEVKPSVAPPSEEVNLADVAIAATDFEAKNQPIAATTTSPIAVHGTDVAQLPPATVSNSTAQPTAAAVLSLSDLQLKDGVVTLPPVSESAAADAQGELAAGRPADSAAGAAGGTTGAAGKPDSSGADASLNQSGARDGAAAGADAGALEGSSQLITLPKDGNFGVVVVGSALEEKYPETAELWSGRMAYTVYLHVGLSKSWILQYSLPRVADAAAAGNATRLEAPWPYNIVRPNLAAGAINADALMVRGIVNAAGRFESLAIVFPQPFAQAAFVLSSLAQWQFRPALQGGQVTPVEVLLIIPDIE